MPRYLVLVASLALMAGGAEGALAQDPANETDRVQSLVQPSVVFLLTTFEAPVRDVNPRFRETLFNGEPVPTRGRCTGFFVNPDGYVATAAHCILPDEAGNSPGETRRNIIDEAAVQAYEEGQFARGQTVENALSYGREWFRLAGPIRSSYVVGYPTTSPSISTEQTTAARRIGYRVFDEGDVGLLKFEAGGVDFPGLELAEDAEVRVGTPLTAVGFPGSVEDVTDDDYNPSFTTGSITRLGTRSGSSVAVYQHDAAVSGGMSGGPVVDADGRVIGLNSFGILGETEAFNFSSPVTILREVTTDKGIENDVGTVGTIYREGVEALYDEKRSTALDRFDEVAKYPGNPAVALVNTGLRSRAQALPEDSGFPTWAWVLVLVLGALALIAIFAVVLSRRRRPTAAPTTPVFAGVPAPAAPPPLRAPTPQAAIAAPPTRAPDTADSDLKPAVIVVGPRGQTSTRHDVEGELIIGREAADILIADEQVSRRHAALREVDGRLELEDLRSSNGTEVNGQRITSKVTLEHGDTIMVGSTELKVELPPSSRGPSASGRTVIRG